MGAIKVAEGSTIRVKGTGRTGRVLTLTKQKIDGKRGRPATLASVVHDDATEATYGVRELQLV